MEEEILEYNEIDDYWKILEKIIKVFDGCTNRYQYFTALKWCERYTQYCLKKYGLIPWAFINDVKDVQKKIWGNFL